MADKKIKTPQRIRLKCTADDVDEKGNKTPTKTCNREFSTHSTNRTMCHVCKPKCNEIHYFHKHKQLAPDNGAVLWVKS